MSPVGGASGTLPLPPSCGPCWGHPAFSTLNREDKPDPLPGFSEASCSRLVLMVCKVLVAPVISDRARLTIPTDVLPGWLGGGVAGERAGPSTRSSLPLGTLGRA